MITTTFVYDDESPYPTRPVSSIQSPSYTAEDRALLVGLDLYEKDLCRCGWPRSVAWHSEMDGWMEPGDRYVCHACTAAAPEPSDASPKTPVTYGGGAKSTRPDSKGPLPPFALGITTSPG